MNETFHLGIDCGDREIAVAYAIDSKISTLPLLPNDAPPNLFFDSLACVSDLGVGFPSVIQSVGTRRMMSVGDRTETPESLVEHSLKAIRQSAQQVTGRALNHTILAVSGGMSQARRKSLLACAESAGFEKTGLGLVDKCTAAAIGQHAGKDKAATVLVIDLGYGNCEYSVVRLSKGKCKVVSAGVVPAVAGQVFDALVIESIVLKLRDAGIFLGLKSLKIQQWFELRRIAESVRHTLARQPETEITLVPELTHLTGPITLRLRASGLFHRISPFVDRILECVQGGLEQNQIDATDLTSVLLTGTSARISPVIDRMRSAFASVAVQSAEPDLVAIGAAYYACQTTDQGADPEVPQSNDLPASSVESGPFTASTSEISPPSMPQDNDFIEIVRAPSVSPKPANEIAAVDAGVPSENALAAARKLAAAGQPRQAVELLDRLIRDAEALRSQLSSENSPGRALIKQSQEMLARGQLLEAVGLSHNAYKIAPDDPVIFSGMMKIHVQASLSMTRPEDYAKSIQILNCAYGHDQTDRSVHAALAERSFQHAVALRNLNNFSLALETVNQALSFDPKHARAGQLLTELLSHANDRSDS